MYICVYTYAQIDPSKKGCQEDVYSMTLHGFIDIHKILAVWPKNYCSIILFGENTNITFGVSSIVSLIKKKNYSIFKAPHNLWL